jgi:hypothetical protein
VDFKGLGVMGASASGWVSSSVPVPVTLHVYSLGTSSEMFAMNAVLMAIGSGAYHCGVEVYGREWSFRGSDEEGTGVFSCRPKQCSDHAWYTSVPMGSVSLSHSEVTNLVRRMMKDWPGRKYDVLKRNCCHFCDELCVALGLGPIPRWTTHLAGAGATMEAFYETSGTALSDTASAIADTFAYLGGPCFAPRPAKEAVEKDKETRHQEANARKEAKRGTRATVR